jgi:hypothetical protein
MTFSMFEQRALGDLEFQPVDRQAGTGQRRDHRIDKHAGPESHW